MADRRPKLAGRSRRIEITLSCSVCGARNYQTTRARREGAGPLRLNKFCKTCKAHTAHIEAK